MTPDKCGEMLTSSFLLGFIMTAIIAILLFIAYESGYKPGEKKI